jgi:uncharacterized membrane-anchored protein
MKLFTLILFIVMCLAQWVVPGKMVFDSERIIADGTLFKFKTAPIDPADPFRGRYITLNFQENFVPFRDSLEWQRGQEIYVTFKLNEEGFAVPDNAYHTPPESPTYLRTMVDDVSHYQGDFKVWYKLPFDRFYLEESKAPQAEERYREAQRDSAQVAYALVSIGPGQAVLQDVIINDRSVTDIINDVNTE